MLKVEDILLLCLIWHHYKCVILSLLGSRDGKFCALISKGSYWFLESLPFVFWIFFFFSKKGKKVLLVLKGTSEAF